MNDVKHLIQKEDGTLVALPCYSSRVPEYYVIVKGKFKENQREFKIRSICEHKAQQLRDNFFKENEDYETVHQIMMKMGWSEIKVIGIEPVE